MSKGGRVANNLRQGFRSEYLAYYVLSQFGPCTRVAPENDYGVDMFGALMAPDGAVGCITTTYAVQVKSDGEPFEYRGEDCTGWLESLSLPLLLMRVTKRELRVRLYSTWTLTCFLLDLKKRRERPAMVEFVVDDGQKGHLDVKQCVGGRVLVGRPIIDVTAAQMSDDATFQELLRVVREWVEFDAANIAKRQAGLSVVKGYVEWQTNRSLKTSGRTYYQPHFFDDANASSAERLLLECATVIGLNEDTKGRPHPARFAALKALVEQWRDDAPDFTKRVFGIG